MEPSGQAEPWVGGAVELREGGLLLRSWRPEDAKAIRRAVEDPAMPRLLREHALASTHHGISSTALALGVFDADTGELAGTCGLVHHDPAAQQAEIGYWTAPAARGRGIATLAARAVARYGLDILGLQRVLWRARVGNHASRLVAARIGVRFEGIARGTLIGPLRTDAWVGALLTGELRESDAPDDPALKRAAVRCHVFSRPQPTLQTTTRNGEPVRLRPLESRDIPACVRACRDPLAVRYTTVPDPYDETHAESFISTYAPGAWARGTEAVFAVADGADDLLGTMALRLPRDELYTTTGDVGYLIGPWGRGRGYASAALRTLTDWGFAELALHRIEWKAYVGNTASRATAERAGFRMEGELRQALPHRGTNQDAWIGARLATDLE